MRLWTLAGIGVLSMTLGIPAVNAQDEKPRSAEPAPEPAKPDTAKPVQQNNDEMKQNQEMKQDQDKMKQDENKPANEAKPSKEEKQQQKDQEKAAKENEARQGSHPEGGQTAAKGRIPDDKFKAHFGREHTFTVNHPTIVGGQPRFQYSGYWFSISQAWPVGWAYTDQCYIDYIDGEYILFDVLHPGVQVVLVIVD
jgi:hypothetical protein